MEHHDYISEGYAIGFDYDSVDIVEDVNDIEERERELEVLQSETRSKLKRFYLINEQAKVGEELVCPSCGKKFIKKSYQQKFCTRKAKKKGVQSCKDYYWNRVDEKRSNRAWLVNKFGK